MNQDQVKEKLLELDDSTEEFSLIFSGKQSKKVNGLYQPETREIIIHNRNFEDDNALLYTAIHEYAHHVHFCRAGKPVSNRAHTVEFRSVFHELLAKAEKMGIYQNMVDSIAELKALSTEIRERFMKVNGELMKDFGSALMEAEKVCRKHNARFEDFIERALCLPQQTAGTLMKMKALDLPADIGYDNMKTLAGIRNAQARVEAVEAFLRGDSPDMVKNQLAQRPAQSQRNANPKKKLISEKKRIEKTLDSLSKRLLEITDALSQIPEDEEIEIDEGEA